MEKLIDTGSTPGIKWKPNFKHF